MNDHQNLVLELKGKEKAIKDFFNKLMLSGDNKIMAKQYASVLAELSVEVHDLQKAVQEIIKPRLDYLRAIDELEKGNCVRDLDEKGGFIFPLKNTTMSGEKVDLCLHLDTTYADDSGPIFHIKILEENYFSKFSSDKKWVVHGEDVTKIEDEDEPDE